MLLHSRLYSQKELKTKLMTNNYVNSKTKEMTRLSLKLASTARQPFS